MAISKRSAARRTTYTPADAHPAGKRSGRLRLLAIAIGGLGTLAIWNSSRAGVTAAPRTPVTSEKPAAREDLGVAGRILDPVGIPARWATVRAVSPDGTPISRPASTGVDGRFKIGPLDAKTVRVVAEHEAGIVESAEIPVSSARNLVLVLEAVPEARGRVLDDRNRPIPRATVKATGGPAWLERIAITDDRGNFALGPTSASVRSLVVWAGGFETASVPLGGVRAGADVHLTRSRPIAGVVVDSWNRPVAGALIQACRDYEMERTISDRTGSFQLPATVVGCTINARHPRFAGSEPLTIRSGAPITLHLAPGGSIEGMVLDEDSRPLASASVGFQIFGGHPVNMDLLERQFDTSGGLFRFDDLPPGTYVLVAKAPDREDVTSDPIDVGPGKTVRGVPIVFAPAEEPKGEEKEGETSSEPHEESVPEQQEES